MRIAVAVFVLFALSGCQPGDSNVNVSNDQEQSITEEKCVTECHYAILSEEEVVRVDEVCNGEVVSSSEVTVEAAQSICKG